VTTLCLDPLRGRAREIVSPYSGSKRDCNPRGGSGWPCTVVDSGAFVLILSTCPRDGQCARSGRPSTSLVGEIDMCVTRTWRGSTGVLGRDRSTDLGLGRPLSRGRGPRLQPTCRPIGTVDLDGLEKVMA
jgi:hypothetical protein